MKKQSSDKGRAVSSSPKTNKQSKFLSLNRQTYKPYLKAKKEDREKPYPYDPDYVIKFAY